ncbi:MAG: sulfatase, partial [Candidatus Omnitrophica bacterium]|nr:sulfatase [Candidatus Omnitrophota bacterium]
YSWNGLLDADPKTPALAVFSGERRLAPLSEANWRAGESQGYWTAPGLETTLCRNYFFAGDHSQYFPARIDWASPYLEWESLAINSDGEGMTLEVALGTIPEGAEPIEPQEGPATLPFEVIWSATVTVGVSEWTSHQLQARGVEAGAHALRLTAKGTFSTLDKTAQRQFFLRNFRSSGPTEIRARLPRSDPPPEVRYTPRDRVRALFAAPHAPESRPQTSPWAVYDESELLVRPLELEGLVRTALFLPTPGSWEVTTRTESASDLIFYPAFYSSERETWLSGRVIVEVSRENLPGVTWEIDLNPSKDEGSKLWSEGIRLPLVAEGPGSLQLSFRSAPPKERTGSETAKAIPFFLGEPMLVPARDRGSRHPGTARPDILLLSIDTLRADAVSGIGGGETTPWMDDYFGRGGVTFTQAEAPSSWTLPSHASLFLSQYVARHGVRMHFDRVPAETATLAERFADQGYETAAFVDREFLNHRFGFHQGFELYDQRGGHFASILPRCLEWLGKRDRGAPLFLFLHTYDVHDPYDPPEAFRARFLPAGSKPSTEEIERRETQMTTLYGANQGHRELPESDAEFLRALYLAETAYVDSLLADFIHQVETRGLLQDPLVILLSDHGEAFREHGTWLHGWTLYEEETRIPILIRFPGNRHQGRRISARVSLLDIAPTLFEILGWSIPEEWQGESLLPRIEGIENHPSERPLYAELTQSERVLASVWKRRMKYIENRTLEGASPENPRLVNREAYDLETDPGERRNLGGERLEEVSRELEAAANNFAEMTSRQREEGTSAAATLDAETIQGLQAIGYLQTGTGAGKD